MFFLHFVKQNLTLIYRTGYIYEEMQDILSEYLIYKLSTNTVAEDRYVRWHAYLQID